jgi:carbon-monoxide dehydrogenase small subunit
LSSGKPDEAKKVSRRDLLKGLGAGAVVAGVAVGGVEEYRILNMAPPAPPPAVTAAITASPTTIQAGGSVTFSATPGGGTPPFTLSIACGDGTTLTAAGAHVYASAGNYTALLTVTDKAGVKAMAAATVTVNALPAPPPALLTIALELNGKSYAAVPVQGYQTLQQLLHDQMGVTSVKDMCSGKGECGSCSVIVGGRPVLSCMTLAIECDGAKVQTAEGIAISGHPITQSWADFDAMQCGYCAPGAIVTAKALLDRNPSPASADVLEALSGNLCVCGTYPQWPKAALDAAAKVKGGK